MRGHFLVALISLALILSPWPIIRSQTQVTRSVTFSAYNSYADIKGELDRISNYYSNFTALRTIGTTWEGRDIMALRVTDNPLLNEDEPDLLIMGGHHGNELPSVEVPLYILEFLVGNYSTNGTVRKLVDTRDIWFVPLVNPDGREYTLSGQGEWRKNRRPIDLDGDGIPEGTGVDLNRNYGHLWGQQGTSTNPNSLTYCGPAPFSENETIAIRTLAMEQNFEISLSFHTYGQQVSYPWNNDLDTLNPKADILEAIATEMTERNYYIPMQGKNLYLTTGDSDDWLYANTSCLPFTIEVGTQYQPPAIEIAGLCGENLAPALYAIEIADEPERAKLPDWTFMVYMAADNSLESEAAIDLNEMEVSGSNTDLNIIVLFDGQTSGDSKLYKVQRDISGYSTTIVSELLDDQGTIINQASKELDMSEPTVLKNFVSWTIQNYQAQRYLLDLWGHGSGVLGGFCLDGLSLMQTYELSQALFGHKLDIVGFDACSMGCFETASELAGIAGILIGSEAEEPISGWDYQNSLVKLGTLPNMTPGELADVIVSDYISKNSQFNYITQAAMDVYVFEKYFMDELNEFASVLTDFAYSEFSDILSARNYSHTLSNDQNTVDLYEFLTHLDNLDIAQPVKTRLARLSDMRDLLIQEASHGSAFPNAESMSIYFPDIDETISPAYDSLSFSGGHWDDFLLALKNPAQMPAISQPYSSEPDSSAGPYQVSISVDYPNQVELTMLYRTNGGQWQSAEMSQGRGTYTFELPGQPNGSVIEYYFLVEYQGQSITGPEPAKANVSVFIWGANKTVQVGMKEVDLSVGIAEMVNFSWTAEPGVWIGIANAVAIGVQDTDSTNQNATIWLNVSSTSEGQEDQNNTFLGDWGAIFGLLVLFSMIPPVIFLILMRDIRKKKRANIARRIKTTKYFIETAKDFGGDVAYPELLLAKAKNALDRGNAAEAEKLALDAREAAMLSVSEKAR
jgi:carboxypeptidase T